MRSRNRRLLIEFLQLRRLVRPLQLVGLRPAVGPAAGPLLRGVGELLLGRGLVLLLLRLGPRLGVGDRVVDERHQRDEPGEQRDAHRRPSRPEGELLPHLQRGGVLLGVGEEGAAGGGGEEFRRQADDGRGALAQAEPGVEFEGGRERRRRPADR